jgi:hypothetical protein
MNQAIKGKMSMNHKNEMFPLPGIDCNEVSQFRANYTAGFNGMFSIISALFRMDGTFIF